MKLPKHRVRLSSEDDIDDDVHDRFEAGNMSYCRTIGRHMIGRGQRNDQLTDTSICTRLTAIRCSLILIPCLTPVTTKRGEKSDTDAH